MIDLCYLFDDRCTEANASCNDLFDHFDLVASSILAEKQLHYYVPTAKF